MFVALPIDIFQDNRLKSLNTIVFNRIADDVMAYNTQIHKLIKIREWN